MPDRNFRCPECGGSLSADESLQGMEGSCPHCQKTITIRFPEPTDSTEPTPPDVSQSESPAAEQVTGSECPSCGTALPNDARFCSNCGSPIPARQLTKSTPKRFCSSCGAALSQDGIICVSCGINQATGKSVTETPRRTPRKNPSLAYRLGARASRHPFLFRAVSGLMKFAGLFLLACMIIYTIGSLAMHKRDRSVSSAAEQFPNAEQLKKARPAVDEMMRLGYHWGARDWCYWFRYAQEYGDVAVLYDEIRAVGIYSHVGRGLLLPSPNTDPAEARKQIALALNSARIDEAPIRLLYGYHQKIIDDMRANGW